MMTDLVLLQPLSYLHGVRPLVKQAIDDRSDLL